MFSPKQEIQNCTGYKQYDAHQEPGHFFLFFKSVTEYINDAPKPKSNKGNDD